MLTVSANDIMRSPWLWEVAPFRIADNLYYVGNKDVSSHLVDTGEGLLLLDTGYTQAAHMLLDSVRAMGFDPADIKWILHSHGHLDHFGCTRILVEKYGCKTYFPAVDLPLLNERADLNWHEEFGQNYEPPYDAYFVPDVLLHPGDVLTFGNTKVAIFDAGGHTPGTLALQFMLPGGLKAAMHGGLGVNTLSSSYSMKKNIGASWRDAFIQNVLALYDLDVDIVLGNHPDQSNTFGKLSRLGQEQNPFVDPTEWKRMLDRCVASYQNLQKNDPII
jgi:metallo-beta-lactamase class B